MSIPANRLATPRYSADTPRNADINLTTRVSLRPIQTDLAWLKSRRLVGAPSACVLRDQGSLRALEAAPPTKTRHGSLS